jgi:hypothetical protein
MRRDLLMNTPLLTGAGICLAFVGACSDAQRDSRSTESRAGSGVVADLFEIRHSLSGDSLSLRVETDLPDETEMVVSVDREYKETGDTTVYSQEYFEESGTVGEWRVPRRVVLDEHVWRNGLIEKQRVLARAGTPFTVGEIDDSVEVSFVVPVNQEDPRFGSRNEHLTGRAVAVGILGWPIIQRSVWLARPTTGLGASSLEWASWSNLRVGHRYQITREVPLVPELEPSDPMGAIARIRQIPAGGTIVILQQRDQRGTLWYQAIGYSPSGAQIGEGWINSTALLGQDIQIVR